LKMRLLSFLSGAGEFFGGHWVYDSRTNQFSSSVSVNYTISALMRRKDNLSSQVLMESHLQGQQSIWRQISTLKSSHIVQSGWLNISSNDKWMVLACVIAWQIWFTRKILFTQDGI
jgi:hypothetical protein